MIFTIHCDGPDRTDSWRRCGAIALAFALCVVLVGCGRDRQSPQAVAQAKSIAGLESWVDAARRKGQTDVSDVVAEKLLAILSAADSKDLRLPRLAAIVLTEQRSGQTVLLDVYFLEYPVTLDEFGFESDGLSESIRLYVDKQEQGAHHVAFEKIPAQGKLAQVLLQCARDGRPVRVTGLVGGQPAAAATLQVLLSSKKGGG